MPKINHFRGETRTFVIRADPGTWARDRHRLWGRRKRTTRGRGGMTHCYREILFDVAIRNWCPCCIENHWRHDLRSQNSRAWGRRHVHRSLRRHDRRLCEAGLAEYENE